MSPSHLGQGWDKAGTSPGQGGGEQTVNLRLINHGWMIDPLGVRAELDADKLSLRFTESVCDSEFALILP